jgi:hypothetical protein
MPTVYRSKLSAAIRETMQDFHNAGLVDDRTMKRFDKSCLVPAKKSQEKPISPNRKQKRSN